MIGFIDFIRHKYYTNKSKKYWGESSARADRCYRCLSDISYIDSYKAEGHVIRLLNKQGIYEFCERSKFLRRMISNLSVSRTLRPYNSIEELEKRNYETRDMSCGKIYVAEIIDAYVIGDIDVIVCGENCLSDQFSYGDHYVEGVISIGEKCALEAAFDKVKKVARAIDLRKMYSNNYYHFTFECLSRFQYIAEDPKYNDYPILMDETAFNSSQNLQLMHIFGVDKHKIIRLSAGSVCHVDCLVYPSSRVWGGISIVSCDTLLVQYYNKCVENYLKSKKYINEKIYIYRGNRLVNEKEVVEVLERQGFKSVRMEMLSIIEQIALFRNASVIVGVHGAAFTNLVYAGDNTILFQISDMKYALFYDSLAYKCGIKLYTIYADAIYDMTFKVSLDKIKELPDRIRYIKENGRGSKEESR